MNRKTFLPALIVFFCLGFFSFSEGIAAERDQQVKSRAPKSLRVLVLTGGHGYDTLDFQKMFDRMPNLQIEYAILEKNTSFFDDISNWNYDVLVFYNFRNRLTEQGKKNFIELCERGKGLVFLHHSVMGFDDWPEFKNIVGAKYYFAGEAPTEKLGTYRHDVTMKIKITDRNQLITKGMKDFELHDEVYGNYWVSDENDLLMTTDHPESQPEIGWTRQYRNSRVVFIQPGHGKEALRDERYTELVRRAILWSKGNEE